MYWPTQSARSSKQRYCCSINSGKVSNNFAAAKNKTVKLVATIKKGQVSCDLAAAKTVKLAAILLPAVNLLLAQKLLQTAVLLLVLELLL